MSGPDNLYFCIAGKNECAINFVKFLSKKIIKENILILPNDSDNGLDNWQPSLKKFAKKENYEIVSLKRIYKIKKLIFISIEFEKIINTDKFISKELFNFHFSLLPKYRGCHTNFFQIFNGEKYSGVTLHKIDKGIDTGSIIDNVKFRLKINNNAYQNYLDLMKNSLKLFKKNFKSILKKTYKEKKQNLKRGSYYSRNSINYKKMKFFELNKIKIKDFNEIRAFIFPPLQLPILNNKVVSKIKYYNKSIKISYD
jgi:methionyl-tRNA formyltransferase